MSRDELLGVVLCVPGLAPVARVSFQAVARKGVGVFLLLMRWRIGRSQAGTRSSPRDAGDRRHSRHSQAENRSVMLATGANLVTHESRPMPTTSVETGAWPTENRPAVSRLCIVCRYRPAAGRPARSLLVHPVCEAGSTNSLRSPRRRCALARGVPRAQEREDDPRSWPGRRSSSRLRTCLRRLELELLPYPRGRIAQGTALLSS
jgi:hypothetical protein